MDVRIKRNKMMRKTRSVQIFYFLLTWQEIMMRFSLLLIGECLKPLTRRCNPMRSIAY